MNRQGENNIYFFNSSEPLAPGDSKQLLGGKVANLREMVRTGLPVRGSHTIRLPPLEPLTTWRPSFVHTKAVIRSAAPSLVIRCSPTQLPSVRWFQRRK